MVDNPNRREDLEINPVADGYVVYDPDRDRVHYLNQTAAMILELCTGDQASADIAESIRTAYRLDGPIGEQVDACIAQLRNEGLISP